MLTIAGGIILAVLILALVPFILGGGIALVETIRNSAVLLMCILLGTFFVGVYLLTLADSGPIRAALALGLGFCLYKIWKALKQAPL